MTRTRVFYGHEGVVPPAGLGSRRAARPAPAAAPAPIDAGDTVADAVEVEIEVEASAVEVADLPDESWSVAELDAFAEDYGVDLSGAKKKGEKLAVILDSLGG